MPRKSKLTPFHDLVGLVPDREIAVMAGVSIATVCHYRRRHSIPSFRSTITSAPKPPSISLPRPVPTPTKAAGGPLQGFSAVVETTEGTGEWYMMASDILGAAIVASKAGRVLKISHLGPGIG